MKTYAIPDLHGRFDLLFAAYNAITNRRDSGTIIHLGDYIDRGPHSKQVLEFLMDEGTILPSFKRVVLKGNHEEIMVDTIWNRMAPDWWISNGGAATLMSYGHPPIINPHEPGDIEVHIPVEHVDFLDGLPMFHADAHRVYCHARVDPDISLPEHKSEIILWGIYPDFHQGWYRGAHVVHGHHEREEPLLKQGRTNLDCGAWRRNKLAIGVFDDSIAGGPIEILEVEA